MSAVSSKKIRVACVVGTRPEAIKMSPVYHSLQNDHERFLPEIWSTGQHREMVDQIFEAFAIKPEVDLDVMVENQSLSGVAAAVMKGVDGLLEERQPDLVLVQGDTNSAFAAAAAAFYRKVPIGHVEAGLRTGDMTAPWPEEANRVLVAKIASLHFAPTETSRRNLLGEGVAEKDVFVTGNTVIDALVSALDKLPAPQKTPERKRVLITGHRRENFGAGFEAICSAIASLAAKYPAIDFVYPMHLNPNVRTPVQKILSGCDNIFLREPQAYLDFVALMRDSYIILTDSGGIQEEAPSLGKPVVVMRESTERPEAVEAGTVVLAGADCHSIVENVSRLLDDDSHYESMARSHNPYGDGHASDRIRDAIAEKFLNV